MCSDSIRVSSSDRLRGPNNFLAYQNRKCKTDTGAPSFVC
jgi:hypothetical protein